MKAITVRSRKMHRAVALSYKYYCHNRAMKTSAWEAVGSEAKL